MIVGRWIGGILGYKPFFREYTTDWDFAVAKMKGSFFQRHLVHSAFEEEKPWAKQAELEPKAKPENAEFESWTEDMSPTPLALGAVAYEQGLFNGLQSGPANESNGHSTGLESELEQSSSWKQRRAVDGAEK